MSKKGWREKKKYSKALRRSVAPKHREVKLKSQKPRVYKTNPSRTVADSKKLAEQTRKAKELELEMRRKQRELIANRPRGPHEYYTERDLRREFNKEGKGSVIPKSHRLERLGYKPLPPKHVNKLKEDYAYARKNNLDVEVVYLGGNMVQSYHRPSQPKPKPVPKAEKQTKITYGWDKTTHIPISDKPVFTPVSEANRKKIPSVITRDEVILKPKKEHKSKPRQIVDLTKEQGGDITES